MIKERSNGSIQLTKNNINSINNNNDQLVKKSMDKVIRSYKFNLSDLEKLTS